MQSRVVGMSALLVAAVIAVGAVPSRSIAQGVAAPNEVDPVSEVAGRGASVSIILPERAPPADATYVTLSTGGLVFVGGQRFVVTNEPQPATVLDEAPPAPPTGVRASADTNRRDAVWVPAHWTHGNDGFVWVEGRHIRTKPGHAFVPPRWVSVQNRYLFFDGFFVPHGVWVRSFFNTYHFSGDPRGVNRGQSQGRDRGPYWPIGATGRTVGTASSRGRGPYWPLGLGPPTVLRTGAGPGLPSNGARR